VGKPNSTKLIEARNKAKREGWLKWIRQGPGEEADERAIINGCWFDLRRAHHWLEFADNYGTLTEGAWKGKPFKLLDWQATETGRLFGWIRHSPEWGFSVRRFRIWFAELPKKQGKTPLLSLMGNYLFFADCVNEDGSPRQINLYNAATSRKQADRLLTHSIRQIKNSEELSSVAEIKRLEGFGYVKYNDNEWNVVAADPASADGVNGHCLADEFHRWKGFEFYNSIKWMIASQPEGVFATITTAGEQGENVWQYTHDHTLAVNAGTVIDESFYGVIYAADRADDPHDEATWFKANPSLGTDATAPLKLSTFRADYESAKADPTSWPAFLRLRLGISQSQTNTWIEKACVRGFADWDSGPTLRSQSSEPRIDCYEPFTDDDLTQIDATTITLALDLASVRDTVAASLSICDQDQIVRNKTWFWLPEKEAMRQAKRVSYQRWAKDGFINLTPGDVIDYRRLLNDLIDICEKFSVARFYFDPLFQAEWLTQELAEATGAERVAFPQTIMHYAPLVKEAERRIINHTIRHNANPVMSWQISNAISFENANGDKRIKKRNSSDYRKVDGVQAMIMSLQDTLSADDGASFYETNEVEEI
jgi:phage terminase large subunit-like protein